MKVGSVSLILKEGAETPSERISHVGRDSSPRRTDPRTRSHAQVLPPCWQGRTEKVPTRFDVAYKCGDVEAWLEAQHNADTAGQRAS